MFLHTACFQLHFWFYLYVIIFDSLHAWLYYMKFCYCCFCCIRMFITVIRVYWYISKYIVMWRLISEFSWGWSGYFCDVSYLSWFENLAHSFCMLLMLLATKFSWSTPNQECSTLSYWKNKVTKGVYQLLITVCDVFVYHYYFFFVISWGLCYTFHL